MTERTDRCDYCRDEWDEELLDENGLCSFCRVGSGQERFSPESNVDVEGDQNV